MLAKKFQVPCFKWLFFITATFANLNTAAEWVSGIISDSKTIPINIYILKHSDIMFINKLIKNQLYIIYKNFNILHFISFKNSASSKIIS